MCVCKCVLAASGHCVNVEVERAQGETRDFAFLLLQGFLWTRVLLRISHQLHTHTHTHNTQHTTNTQTHQSKCAYIFRRSANVINHPFSVFAILNKDLIKR